jgi:hypothetical protein
MSAGGMMGPVVNALLKPILRPMAEGFAKKISARLKKRGEEENIV